MSECWTIFQPQLYICYERDDAASKVTSIEWRGRRWKGGNSIQHSSDGATLLGKLSNITSFPSYVLCWICPDSTTLPRPRCSTSHRLKHVPRDVVLLHDSKCGDGELKFRDVLVTEVNVTPAYILTGPSLPISLSYSHSVCLSTFLCLILRLPETEIPHDTDHVGDIKPKISNSSSP